jgi:hypothetical protein
MLRSSHTGVKKITKHWHMTPLLNERQRRLYLADEAKAIGHGGITQVSKVSGVSRVTITQGLKEAREAGCSPLKGNKSRKAGGGRKPISQKEPRILQELEALLAPHTKGSPMAKCSEKQCVKKCDDFVEPKCNRRDVSPGA